MGRFKNVLPYFQDRILLVNEAPRLKVGVKGKSMSAGDFILYAFSEHKKNVKDPSKVKRESLADSIYYFVSTLQKNVYFTCNEFRSAGWLKVDETGEFEVPR